MSGVLQEMTYIDVITELIFIPGRIAAFIGFIIWFFALCVTKNQKMHEKYLGVLFTGVSINQILVFYVNFAEPFGWKVLVIFAILTLLNFITIIMITVASSIRNKA